MEEKRYQFNGPEDLLAYRLEAITGLLQELYDRHGATPWSGQPSTSPTAIANSSATWARPLTTASAPPW